MAPIHMILWCLVLLMAGCARLPQVPDRPPERAFLDTADTVLGRGWAQAQAGARAAGEDAFRVLGNGLDAFVARAALIEAAQRGIDLQYYMIHDDAVGRLLMERLLRAADRGVRVRILLDDIDEGHRDFDLAAFDRHPNIEVRLFNPFGRNVARIWQFITGFGRQTRRAHNKSFTVDGLATIVGGRNIGDEYFERDPELAFQDLDLLAIGPVARGVAASFDHYWNHPLSIPVSVLVAHKPDAAEYRRLRRQLEQRVAAMRGSVWLVRLADSPLAEDLRHGRIDFAWGRAQVLADDPDKLRRPTDRLQGWLFPQLLQRLQQAKKELILVSPYFVPGEQGVAWLRRLAARGVKVRILTNSLASTDVSIVHAGYVRYRRELLRAGVALWELNDVTPSPERKRLGAGYAGRSRHSLHAKVFVVDRRLAFVGSLNLDPRSVVQNTEIGLLVDAPAIARELAATFDREVAPAAFRLELRQDPSGRERLLWHGFEAGRSVTWDHDPHVAWWRRLGIWLLRWLPMESQI